MADGSNEKLAIKDDPNFPSNDNFKVIKSSIDVLKEEEEEGEEGVVQKIGADGRSSTNASQIRTKLILESSVSKITAMQWPAAALLANSAMLVLIFKLQSGIVINNLTAEQVYQYLGVIFEILLQVTIYLTVKAMDQATSVFFGFLLSSKNGFSIAACGYVHTRSLQKYEFSTKLPMRSYSRKVFQRLSLIWLLVESFHILALYAASQFQANQISSQNDVADCMYFTQAGKMVDRKWPTFQTEFGVAEYVFGTSIGHMRSEEAVDVTEAIFPPTIISGVNDGDTILGPGFSVKISTKCVCAKSSEPDELIEMGVPAFYSKQASTYYKFQSLTPDIGMSFAVDYDADQVNITNVISGMPVCGGYNASFPLVCSTRIYDHFNVNATVEFMTDGTPASIAMKKTLADPSSERANIDKWLGPAFANIIGCKNRTMATHGFPPQIPGSMSTLLWWTTPNLIAVDASLLEAGMETLYSILFRGSIQRSYNTQGKVCQRTNTALSSSSNVALAQAGFATAATFIAIQTFICGVCILAFLPWLLGNNPIGPAIKALNEKIYFITLISASTIGQGLYPDFLPSKDFAR